MVLELRDKLPAATVGQAIVAPTLSAVEEDVISALVNLGYQRAAAEKALTSPGAKGKAGSFDGLFRAALGSLSK
jgi:Holliday junction DNA helicase RuvA